MLIVLKNEMEKILDLWEKQFPNVVLSSKAFCPIITRPNIAKSMSMEEKIWEISCEGVELSAIQEEDPEENKIEANIRGVTLRSQINGFGSNKMVERICYLNMIYWYG